MFTLSDNECESDVGLNVLPIVWRWQDFSIFTLPHTLSHLSVITAGQWSCGKVMFSVVSVCHSVHMGEGSLCDRCGPVQICSLGDPLAPALLLPGHTGTQTCSNMFTWASPYRANPPPELVEICSLRFHHIGLQWPCWKASGCLRLKALLVSQNLFGNFRLCFHRCLWFCSKGGSGRHPPGQTAPPPGRHPLGGPPGRHPPAQCMLGYPPPNCGHCSARWASYWNAFLFFGVVALTYLA